MKRSAASLDDNKRPARRPCIEARGKYNLFDAVPAYLKHLRDNKGSDVNARLKLAQQEKLEIANKKE